MLIVSILLRSLLILFISFLPGFSLTYFLPYKKEEKFVLSFALSFILYYIFGFLWYVSGSPIKIVPIGIILLLGISLVVIVKKKMIDRMIFRLFLLFGMFFLILIGIQSLIPYYGGGMWYFDWWEHFSRSIFFLERLPLSMGFGPFMITSRPPFFNVLSAVYMSIVGNSFSSYQIIATILNGFMILPVFLFVKQYFPQKSAYSILFLLSFFMLLNPSIMTQIMYTWTKGFSAAFFVLGLFFYLSWKKSGENLRFILTVLFLSSAILIHYSSIIYILLMGIDFIVIFIKERKIHFQPLLLSLSVIVLLLGSWFVWSVTHFGLEKSFLKDAHISWQRQLTFAQFTNKNLNNLYYSFIPVISDRFRGYTSYQPSPFSFQSDILFIFHATTFVGSLTIAGTFILLIYLFAESLTLIRTRKFIRNVFSFLPLFVFFALLFAPIAEPVTSPTGVAHTVYVPLILIVLSVVFTQLMKIVYQKNVLTGVWMVLIILEGVLGTGLWIRNLRINDELVQSGKLISSYHTDNIQLKKRENLIFLYDEIHQ